MEYPEGNHMTDSQVNGVLATAQKLIEQHVLCDRCLGRQFGWLSTNTSNIDRGHSLKLTLCMVADEQLKSGKKDFGSDSIRLLASNGMFDPAKTIAEKTLRLIMPLSNASFATTSSIAPRVFIPHPTRTPTLNVPPAK